MSGPTPMHYDEHRFMADLAIIREVLTPEALAAIRRAHNGYGWACAAASEGQVCCMAMLTDPDNPTFGGRDG